MISLSTNLSPGYRIPSRNEYVPANTVDRVGYVVRQTKFQGSHRDIAVFMVDGCDGYAYFGALEVAQIVREEYPDGYAVIDGLYADDYSGGVRILG